jgi:hypothetical protein
MGGDGAANGRRAVKLGVMCASKFTNSLAGIGRGLDWAWVTCTLRMKTNPQM